MTSAVTLHTTIVSIIGSKIPPTAAEPVNTCAKIAF